VEGDLGDAHLQHGISLELVVAAEGRVEANDLLRATRNEASDDIGRDTLLQANKE
jgi:hypothetical protein